MKISKATLNSEIQRIYDRDNKVQASVVLDESRPKTAPLHTAFEWRNSVAAQEYRLEQARRLVRRARIIENDQPVQLVHVPRVRASEEQTSDVSAEASRQGYYQLASIIAKDVDVFAAAYEAAQQALLAATRRVQELEASVRGRNNPDDELARIQVALKALSTAETALQHTH
jgi:hypothetical protein